MTYSAFQGTLPVVNFLEFENKIEIELKFCFISLNMWTFRTTVSGQKKILCKYMKCHYMMLRLVCCECNCDYQTIFLRPQIHTSILGRFWHHVLDMCHITRGTVLSSRRECNSKHCKQFCILFRECLYWQNNKHENVACLFARYEQGQFLLWGTLRDKIYKMYSMNLCATDNLREKEVKKESKCSVFHFTSRTLSWMNNEYFRWFNSLEAEGYQQLNSDESTDTWGA